MVERVPVYKAYIDWFGHGGLSSGLNAWHTEDSAAPSSVALSTEQVFRSGESIKVIGGVGGNSELRKSIGAPGGVQTTVSVWVYIPTGSYAGANMTVTTASEAFVGANSTSVHDAWVELTVPYTAISDVTYLVSVEGTGATGTGIYYLGWSQLQTALDDVSCDLLGTRTVPVTQYGRDEAKELSGIRPGVLDIELDNHSKNYTPGNLSSPLAGGLEPNREVLVTAEFEGQVYTLFTGFTQNYVLTASINEQSVHVPCVDLLARLSDLSVSTDLFESVRTGGAIRAILDNSGIYPAVTPDSVLPETWTRFEPYIDSGATTLRYWSFRGNALDGLQAVNNAEGPPALYSVGTSNQIIFRDRHHRVRPPYDPTASYTLVGCEEDVVTPATEFALLDDSTIDYGWLTIFNRVRSISTSSSVDNDISTVWTDPLQQRTFSNTITITADVDGFFDGQAPIKGSLVTTQNAGPEETNIATGVEPDNADYVVIDGSVSLMEYAESGSRVSITLAAAGTATIRGLRFRARAVSNDQSEHTIDDAGSQTFYGLTREFEYAAGDASPEDARDVSEWILRQNSSTRPRATLTYLNKSADAMAAILSTDLSQAFQATVEQWNVDTIFVAESLSHSLGELGHDHTLTIQAESQVPLGFENVEFTLDTAGKGFDQGVFGGQPAFPVAGALPDAFIIGTSELDSNDQIWY